MLDLIEEGDEEDEIDEDLIEQEMMENLLFQQFKSISGLDASIVLRTTETAL